MSCISVNHSLKIDTSVQSFSEPYTENSTNPATPAGRPVHHGLIVLSFMSISQT